MIINSQWPPISTGTLRGQACYIVDTRTMQEGVRVGGRKYVFSKSEAEGYASELRRLAKKEGHQPIVLNLDMKAAAVRAEAMLKPYGHSLLEAVEFYVEHLKNTKCGNVAIETALDEWYETKVKQHSVGKYSDQSLSSARHRVTRIKTAFGGKQLSDITPLVIKHWVKTSKFSTATLAGTKSIASEFFNWCVDAGYMQVNPCLTTRIKHERDKEVDILTNEQVEALLLSCRASHVKEQAVPYTLLGLYAGLRPQAEAGRLEWEKIDFKENHVEVKSYTNRYVPMIYGEYDRLPSVLVDFKGKGKIIGKNWEKNWKAIRRNAGFGDKWKYPVDALRHTFASNWLAMSVNGVKGFEGGKHRLSGIMENKPPVLDQHYIKYPTFAEAKKFMTLLQAACAIS